MKKRSVSIYSHRTSISLEEPFWVELRFICEQENISLQKLIERIDETRTEYNLSSTIRLYILNYYKMKYDQKLPH